MRIRYGIGATILLMGMIGSNSAEELGPTAKYVQLDKEGGSIEIRTLHPDDKKTRKAVRDKLQKEAREGAGTVTATPAMQAHGKEIRYRYENTPRGGRIHIIARNHSTISIVQDFLRSQITRSQPGAVAFQYVANTSLVVLPVMVNGQGPYMFLLDTGASNTILSAQVADALKIPKGRSQTLSTPGGSISVTMRTVNLLETGAARLEDVEIAVGNINLMKTMNLDGILGSDYLRRFKVSIDYDNQLVVIEPCCPDMMSKLA